MVDYMIFDIVRDAISDAITHGKSIGFNNGAIVAEIKNLPKAEDASNVREFVFSETITAGTFSNRKELEFLRGHVHEAHLRHSKGQRTAPTGWGRDSIVLGYKTLYFAEEPNNYSIVIGVMGAGGEINTQLVDEVLKNLPN